MPNLTPHFNALLSAIEPAEDRCALVREQVEEVRNFLQDHAFPTTPPHTLLSGSYARSTAVGTIKDVDILVFVPQKTRDGGARAVIAALQKAVKEYPNATLVETARQRRSVRLSLPELEVDLDLVPAFEPDKMLEVPDRTKDEWIASDPLGYAARLSKLNQDNGGKLVRLVKLWKAWRDAQMKTRRPKSYMLEILLFRAVDEGDLDLEGLSMEACMRESLVFATDRWHDLFEDKQGGTPRILDPQTSTLVSSSWTREEFETFMRRAREARRAAERAAKAQTTAEASAEWQTVFGDARWPDDEDVKRAVAAEAAGVQLGKASVGPSGLVAASGRGGVVTRPTKFFGAPPA